MTVDSEILKPSLKLLLRGTLQLEGIRYCKVSETLGSTGFVVSEGDIDAKKDIVREIPLLYHTQKGETSIIISFSSIISIISSAFLKAARPASFVNLMRYIRARGKN